MPSDEPDTHTVTTTIDDDLRHALATAAGVRPASVRVIGAAAGAGELTIEIEGAELGSAEVDGCGGA